MDTRSYLLLIQRIRYIMLVLFCIAILPSQAQEEDAYFKTLKKLVQSNPSQAIHTCDSLLNERSHSTDLYRAKLYYYQASAYNTNTDYQASLKAYQKALPVFKSTGEYVFYIKTLLGESSANGYLGNQSLSASKALEALEFAKENGLKDEIASSLNSLSFIHYKAKDYLKSIAYLKSCEAIQLETQDSFGLSSTYNNIAIIYRNIGQYKNALEYNNKSLVINLARKNINGIAKSYSNLGMCQTDLGQYDSAIVLYNKAITTNALSDIQNSTPLRNLGSVYMRKKDYPKAEESLLLALNMEQSNQNNATIFEIYDDLFDIAIAEKAINKISRYKQKTDEYASLISQNNTAEQIKALEQQHQAYIQKQELLFARNRTRNMWVLIGILVLLFSFILLFFRQQFKVSQLKNERNKIILEQKVLRSQMNPHFIYNALSAIQNSLMDGNPIQSADYLSRFARLIRQNFDFIEQEKITVADDIEALDNYIQTQQLRFKDKFDYKIVVDSVIEQDLIKIPPMLLQPFVENAIEHGLRSKTEKGQLSISIQSIDKDKLQFEITDNGKGYFPKTSDKLHAIDIIKKRLELMGTGNEKSFFIQNLGKNKGTSVRFELTI